MAVLRSRLAHPRVVRASPARDSIHRALDARRTAASKAHMGIPGMFTKQWMMAAAVALVMAGCGGGGDSEPTTSVSGVVVDGYLAGATVCLDVNANGKCDTGEASATTNASGAFTITGVKTSVATASAQVMAGKAA